MSGSHPRAAQPIAAFCSVALPVMYTDVGAQQDCRTAAGEAHVASQNPRTGFSREHRQNFGAQLRHLHAHVSQLHVSKHGTDLDHGGEKNVRKDEVGESDEEHEDGRASGSLLAGSNISLANKLCGHVMRDERSKKEAGNA